MIENFRDLSCYTNREGKRLKRGLFMRSAALDKSKYKKEIDVNHLTVIDLRTDGERLESSDIAVSDYHAVPVLKADLTGITHNRASDEDLAKKIPDMVKMYSDIVSGSYALEQFRKIFAIITDPDRDCPVLWHCTQGKDRCGIVTMLFLKMLDYGDKVIMEDYLKSNDSSKFKANFYYFLARYLKKDMKLAESVKKAFAAKEEYLMSAMDSIVQQYGSIDRFLLLIGIDEQVKQRMKDTYME